MRSNQINNLSEKEILGHILQTLIQIDEKLDVILQQALPTAQTKKMDFWDEKVAIGLDVMTLLSLPEHLRTTATALFETGQATAEDVSKVTRKERAVESGYLNQLVRMGHVKKCREGRKIYFCVDDGQNTDIDR